MEIAVLGMLLVISAISVLISSVFHAGKKLSLLALAVFGLVALINPDLANELKTKASEKIKEKIRTL